MQTMFHSSTKEHVYYVQEKKKISYPIDFGVFHITRLIFLSTLHQLITHPKHWDKSENLK